MTRTPKKPVTAAESLAPSEAFYRLEEYSRLHDTPEGPALHLVLEKEDGWVVAWNDRTKSPVLIQETEACISYYSLLLSNDILGRFSDKIESILDRIGAE